MKKKSRGRKKDWDARKQIELLTDVRQFVLTGMSERAACIEILKNTDKYAQLYGVISLETLYRKMMEAKNSISEGELKPLFEFLEKAEVATGLGEDDLLK